jgi:hypothetical protein
MKTTSICFAALLLVLASPGVAHGKPSMFLSARALPQGFSVDFEDLLKAHGWRRTPGIESYILKCRRITYRTSVQDFFERSVVVSVDGASLRLKREIADPVGSPCQVEIFAGNNGYIGWLASRDGNTRYSLDATEHLAPLKCSIEISGLLPLLIKFGKAQASTWAGRGSDGLGMFDVKASDGRVFRVLVDQHLLIRKIVIGGIELQFADFRDTQGLMLPYIESVSTQGRLVYQLYFSEVELNPDFGSGYFDPVTR